MRIQCNALGNEVYPPVRVILHNEFGGGVVPRMGDMRCQFEF
jgi:hypothetical protein